MGAISASNKRIVKNTLLLYIRQFVALLIGIYTSRVVLSTLGNSDFGLYNVVGSVVLMFNFLSVSMTSATSRFLAFELGKGDKLKLQKTFSSALITHILIAVCVLVLAESVGLWYMENKLVVAPDRMVAARWVYQFSVLTTLVNIVQVPFSATLLAREKMSAYAYIEILKVILLLLIVFVLLIGKMDKLILYAILTFLVTLCTILIYGIYCKKTCPECVFSTKIEKPIVKQMLSFSGWNLYMDFSHQAQAQGINIIFNLFFGTLINAAYSIGAQVFRLLTVFTSSFAQAFKPQITKLFAQNQLSQMKALVFTSTRYMFLITMIIGIPLLLEVDFLLDLWLVRPPEYAGILAQFFIGMYMINVFWLPLTFANQATGKVKQVSIIKGTSFLVIPIVVYIIFALGCKTIWVAQLVNLISYFFIVLISLWCVKKVIPSFEAKKFISKVYIYCLILLVVCSIVPVLLHLALPKGWLRLIVVGFSSVGITCLVAYHFVLSKDVRKELVQMILRKLKLNKFLKQ